jgi:DNA-binding XRE family transcriptional regulator
MKVETMDKKKFIEIREYLGLTQGELAIKLAFSRKTVNGIENGSARIDNRTVLAMKYLLIQFTTKEETP